MRKHIALLFACLSALLAQAASASVAIDFYSNGTMEGGSGLTSSGITWLSEGNFTFELGVFSDFTPTPVNLSNWDSAWTLAAAGGEFTGISLWHEDGAATYYYGFGGYLTNDSPFSIGTRLYVWGYNTKDLLDEGAEWILLTNDQWTVVSTANPTYKALDTLDTGTIALLGSISNGGYNLQSASVGGSPIPESATCAAMLGASALGFVIWRRKKAIHIRKFPSLFLHTASASS